MNTRPPAALVGTPDRTRFAIGASACTLTAVALLAWLITPPVAVMIISGAGLISYAARARQAHVEGACILRDTRLRLAYLAAAFLAGAVVTAVRWWT
jgi:hypothetical protein